MGRRSPLAESELVLALPCRDVRAPTDDLADASGAPTGIVHALDPSVNLHTVESTALRSSTISQSPLTRRRSLRTSSSSASRSSSVVTAAAQRGSGTLAAAVRRLPDGIPHRARSVPRSATGTDRPRLAAASSRAVW